jgi:MerR family transcriptional regulator/heat shock protein HspR
MIKEYWTVREVIEIMEIDEDFISDLEKEEIICPIYPEGRASKRFSANDMDRLRLAKTLMEDMEVNLPGVEIILRMRQDMIDMRRQFDHILEDMARQIKETFGKNF